MRRMRSETNDQTLRATEITRRHWHRLPIGAKGAKLPSVSRAQDFRGAKGDRSLEIADGDFPHVRIDDLGRGIFDRHSKPEPARLDVEDCESRQPGIRVARRIDRALEQLGAVRGVRGQYDVRGQTNARAITWDARSRFPDERN